MRYKKIRGLKRKVSNIENWINESLKLDVNYLNEVKYDYIKVYVDPWYSAVSKNSQYREPKGKAKKEILNGLEKIYNSWKTTLDALNKPYYLKIWLYEPRISMSQVVCAIDQKIEYYETLFEEGNFKQNSNSITNQLSSDFNWLPKIDEDHYSENELLSPIEIYQKPEDCYSDRKLLSKLKKGNYRKQETNNPNEKKDTTYFVPKGKIWVGGK